MPSPPPDPHTEGPHPIVVRAFGVENHRPTWGVDKVGGGQSVDGVGVGRDLDAHGVDESVEQDNLGGCVDGADLDHGGIEVSGFGINLRSDAYVPRFGRRGPGLGR
ncbi:hypothetical protein [Rhodococcus globerulus]|uniref:hypothetical protein n=1 Tax=Rhodococcus globerulus TaxID=33008 RepID=UPI003017A5C3